MRNYQDVLLQKDLDVGALWCDEGVYRIAKEIQLLNHSEFSNIFIGLGGFHMEKIVIKCIGKFLAETGVENEIFGKVSMKGAMEGVHYAHGKRGYALLAEALHHLQMKLFLKKEGCSQFEK